jgi:cytidine deaminase
MHEEMLQMLPEAASFARPPISNFKVGAVARGTSGKLYAGANVEFAGQALSFTVHAEQAAVVHAWMAGETGIDVIATSAAPCGYCRQFLNELTTAKDLTVVMPGGSSPLAELLPRAFGPRDLGIEGGLLQSDDHGLGIEESDDLARAALTAANLSYAPYSKSFAGVALQTRDGAIVTGAYAENAAFNPSMSPLEAALSQLNLRRGAWGDIVDAVLVAVDSLHDRATAVVLESISSAPLRVIRA